MKELSSVKIQPVQSGGVTSTAKKGIDGDEFSKTLEQTLGGGKINGKVDGTTGSQVAKPTDFKPIDFKFSNHAVERMRTRGISFSPDQMQEIQSAFGRAQEKGSKEALIVSDDSAMVASIKNKTVVTVLDKAALKENVFTNIDSTLFI